MKVEPHGEGLYYVQNTATRVFWNINIILIFLLVMHKNKSETLLRGL